MAALDDVLRASSGAAIPERVHVGTKYPQFTTDIRAGEAGRLLGISAEKPRHRWWQRSRD
ncbi:hypothetical protein [Mycobacteroides abscessus]|uniref:hypothetical protein n=1 Tax=Mycobacteroides abscessus TaxID=36809 RepID=UPI0019D0A97C|nr:hypothetical protein [Mycobacteroides abscessus]MBN7381620.1 hypothetical protein [Mycobacteroides abscessus subsp. massiliense]